MNATDPLPSPHPLIAAKVLAWRELIRFFRQPNRVIGALGQPLLFWGPPPPPPPPLLGVGLDRSFRLSPAGATGEGFLEYYFPGTLVLMILFTSIFSTISIIEDRKEGFLQSVLISPTPRWAMTLGKISGGAAIAFLQSLVFLGLSFMIYGGISLVSLLLLLCFLSCSAIALTSLGFFLAWRMESTQGFHAIMNLLLMPMWLLSGAFFPIPPHNTNSVSQNILHWVMTCNPVSYIVGGTRYYLFGSAGSDAYHVPEAGICWIVVLSFLTIMFLLSCWISSKRTKGDLL